MEDQRFADLPAWQAARDFALVVYRVTEGWREAERNGLTAEIRSAAVAVPAKIANGHARDEPVETAEQLHIARRSLRDVDVRLAVAEGLGFVDQASVEALAAQAAEVRRLVDGLLASLPDPVVTVDPFHSPFSEN